jgi:hypothetical protein
VLISGENCNKKLKMKVFKKNVKDDSISATKWAFKSSYENSFFFSLNIVYMKQVHVYTFINKTLQNMK